MSLLVVSISSLGAVCGRVDCGSCFFVDSCIWAFTSINAEMFCHTVCRVKLWVEHHPSFGCGHLSPTMADREMGDSLSKRYINHTRITLLLLRYLTVLHYSCNLFPLNFIIIIFFKFGVGEFKIVLSLVYACNHK